MLLILAFSDHGFGKVWDFSIFTKHMSSRHHPALRIHVSIQHDFAPLANGRCGRCGGESSPGVIRLSPI